jgi:hypothetical protein
MDRYNLIWPSDFDDYMWWEVENKGWLGVVEIWMNGEVVCPIFYDPGRLAQEIADGVSSKGYLFELRTIVVDRICRASIEAAVEKLARSGGLSRLMSTLLEDEIAEIGLDSDEKLYLRPRTQTFPHIWPTANWDPVRGVVYGPRPKDLAHPELSYPASFHRILAEAASMYGVRLKLNARTIWSGIPDALRSEIERAPVDPRELDFPKPT